DMPAESDEVVSDETPSDEGDLPDWMSDLPAESDEVVSDETPSDDGDLPDWMSDMPAVDEPAEAETEAITPDWLSDMPAESDEVVSDETPSDDGDLPDWMSDMPAVDEPAETEPDTPDWLSEMPVVEADDETDDLDVESDKVALPDWLAEARADDSGKEDDLTDKDMFASEETLPDWLSDAATTAGVAGATASAMLSPDDEMSESTETDGLSDGETEIPTPAWMSEAASESLETPDWLSDDASAESLETPDWLAGDSDQDQPPTPDWLTETPKTELTTPDWLTDVPTDDTTTPDWLTKMPTTESADDIPTADWLDTPVDEASTPDWLTEIPQAETDIEIEIETETKIETEPLVEAESEADHDAQSSNWMANLRDETEVEPTAEPLPVDSDTGEFDGQFAWLSNLRSDDAEADTADIADTESELGDTESVGETAGLGAAVGGLIPTPADERIDTPEPLVQPKLGKTTSAAAVGMTTLPTLEPQDALLKSDPDSLLHAANEFYEIATKRPQPATLPAPLTQPEKLMGGAIRAGLYLLFISLLTLPLIPGLQRTVDNHTVAWTEPLWAKGEVLAKQRSELISEELGVIDIQPVNSVALVSFDYTPATEGEMKPLAQAMLRRLRGQGMRIIALSLNPEGSALAQQTIDEVLTQRGETYGDTIINVGFIPGQINGIRALLSEAQRLDNLTDFQSGNDLNQFDNWQEVETFQDVRLLLLLSDEATTARWWIEQMDVQSNSAEQFLLAATSATVSPFMQPYRDSEQLHGHIAGINGAAAMESTRNTFGLARQMLDSQSIAHLIIIILIAAGTIIGWMPPLNEPDEKKEKTEPTDEDHDNEEEDE
ncbi:hypothetical protein QUF58_11420, partial [Anaerolineales bacterium HSG24]|nr:hypothetical protein [Anaerolineales bacterium HSG24]